jgi:hypothetical protein
VPGEAVEQRGGVLCAEVRDERAGRLAEVGHDGEDVSSCSAEGAVTSSMSVRMRTAASAQRTGARGGNHV